MAYYKNGPFLQQDNGNAFDRFHHPGEQTPYSGIYRCEGCGHEIVSVREHVMPPQNHHQHSAGQGAIRWRLIVATTH